MTLELHSISPKLEFQYNVDFFPYRINVSYYIEEVSETFKMSNLLVPFVQ